MKKITRIITGNEQLFIRVVLFAAFLGHGLVSLHASEGYELHYSIFSSVNIFHLDVDKTLMAAGICDIIIGIIFLLNTGLKYIAPAAILYLLGVGISGGIYFMDKTGDLFGIAELFRRVPWMFCAFFLWLIVFKEQKHHYLLRMGIAFAFFAHGLASLGFFGLRGGHVELASKVLTEESASKFVYYSGISDSILGLMLFSGLASRFAAVIGTLWLAFVVFLSAQVGIPEAIFRVGFFLMCLFVAIDMRCHKWKYEKLIPLKSS